MTEIRKARTVIKSFFKYGTDSAAHLRICAPRMVKQKMQSVSFSHAEGWSDWNSNLVNVRVRY